MPACECDVCVVSSTTVLPEGKSVGEGPLPHQRKTQVCEHQGRAALWVCTTAGSELAETRGPPRPYHHHLPPAETRERKRSVY